MRSGGQRKRVNIGLELVARPSVLFMVRNSPCLSELSVRQISPDLATLSEKPSVLNRSMEWWLVGACRTNPPQAWTQLLPLTS